MTVSGLEQFGAGAESAWNCLQVHVRQLMFRSGHPLAEKRVLAMPAWFGRNPPATRPEVLRSTASRSGQRRPTVRAPDRAVTTSAWP